MDELTFVDNMIGDIVKTFELDPLSSTGNIPVVKSHNSQKQQRSTKNDDWQNDDEKYSKVVQDSCILLRKLFQFADDVSVDNKTFTKDEKISILQNIAFAARRIDSKINNFDTWKDVDDIFKVPIDNSRYIHSELKKQMGLMDVKQARRIIEILHNKTKNQGSLPSDSELSMLAYMMSLQNMKNSVNDIYKCMKIYCLIYDTMS